MKDKFLNLTAVLSRIKRDQKDSLSGLPDRIAAVIEAYDRIDVNEQKRQDIYQLITGSLALAEALAGDTYPAPVGVRWSTHLISILTRIINHLEDRPAVARLGLLCAETGELHSETYTTPHEANEALSALRRFGATRAFEVVPVTITSGHVVQPPAASAHSAEPQAPQVGPVEGIPPGAEPPEAVEDLGLPADNDIDSPIVIPRGVKPA